MTYIVKTRFVDLQDNRRVYEAGDVFPRLDHEVSPERIAELAGSDNRMGYPLIEPIDDNCAECAVEAPETALDGADKEIPADDDKPAKKPRRARNKE